jgi:Temperature dependent protein affecting M2 dsRNA replication
MNTYWRMLQLRDFIDSKEHTLTPWGRALEAAISSLIPADSFAEPIYLGIELLRLKILKPDNFAPSLSGAPSRGSGNFPTTLYLSRHSWCGNCMY